MKSLVLSLILPAGLWATLAQAGPLQLKHNYNSTQIVSSKATPSHSKSPVTSPVASAVEVNAATVVKTITVPVAELVTTTATRTPTDEEDLRAPQSTKVKSSSSSELSLPWPSLSSVPQPTEMQYPSSKEEYEALQAAFPGVGPVLPGFDPAKGRPTGMQTVAVPADQGQGIVDSQSPVAGQNPVPVEVPALNVGPVTGPQNVPAIDNSKSSPNGADPPKPKPSNTISANSISANRGTSMNPINPQDIFANSLFNKALTYEDYYQRNWMWIRCRTKASQHFDVGGSWVRDHGLRFLKYLKKPICGPINWRFKYNNGQGWGDGVVEFDWYLPLCNMQNSVRAAIEAAMKDGLAYRRRLYVYNCPGFDEYPWSYSDQRVAKGSKDQPPPPPEPEVTHQPKKKIPDDGV